MMSNTNCDRYGSWRLRCGRGSRADLGEALVDGGAESTLTQLERQGRWTIGPASFFVGLRILHFQCIGASLFSQTR